MAGRRVKDFLSVQVGRFHFLGQHVLRPLSFLRQRVKGGVLDRKPQSTQRHPGGRYRDGVCRSAGSTLKTSHALWLPENARHIIRQRIDFEFYPHIFQLPLRRLFEPKNRVSVSPILFNNKNVMGCRRPNGACRKCDDLPDWA